MKAVKINMLALLLVFSATKAGAPAVSRNSIDVVFCLDLSGSTNGLLDDVREKIWDIVNQVHSFRPAPEFRIGVVGFSRPSFGARNGYVKVLQDLTSDFDRLNFELYKLKPSIEKGDQFVGQALKVCLTNLNWSEQSDAARVIYLVGNGMVNAGGGDYRESCELAVRKGIIVNTVYCRTRNYIEKEVPGWREIARLTGGEQYDMRVHKRTPLIMTSPDFAAFRSLAADLSATYIGFSAQGAERMNIMASNDRNAQAANDMTYESRLFYKISDRYQFHQQAWDLVDYLKISNSDFSEIQREFLTDSLRFMNAASLREVVLKAKDRRNRIILDIRKHIPFDRQTIINAELKEKGMDKSDVFDQVVIRSISQLAIDHGFSTGAAASIEFHR